MKRHNGFTLTELLVLVPIGATVGALLLASLDSAKQTMQAAACLNNMRQWGLAFTMYANDHNGYWPYVGSYYGPVCASDQAWAWHEVVPPYIGQKTLCQLYTAGTPPTPLARSIWICPSAIRTNQTLPTLSAPYFTYALNVSLHQSGNTKVGISRNRMTSPANTIVFVEEPDSDPTFGATTGKYICLNVGGAYDASTARHSGGMNFVMGDGHAEWISITNYCRECPANPFAWDASGTSGDWGSKIPYHWWPFSGASTAPN